METNSLRGSSTQTVHSIELKFVMYIRGHHSTYFIDFSEFRINLFLTGAERRITAYGIKL